MKKEQNNDTQATDVKSLL